MRHQSSIGERLAASDDPTDCGHRYSAVFGLPVPESWLSSRAMPSQVTLKPNGSAKLPKAVDGTPLINDLKFGIPEQQPEAFAGAAGFDALEAFDVLENNLRSKRAAHLEEEGIDSMGVLRVFKKSFENVNRTAHRTFSTVDRSVVLRSSSHRIPSTLHKVLLRSLCNLSRGPSCPSHPSISPSEMTCLNKQLNGARSMVGEGRRWCAYRHHSYSGLT